MITVPKRPYACVLSLVLLGASTVGLHADDNPLREFFPYGVYVGGNDPEGLSPKDTEALRAAIDRTCEDLAAHHMNCAWPNNLIWENLPLWLEAGRRHGLRIIPQGGGPPGFVRARWFSGREDFAQRVEPFYQELAEKHRDDPALLAWSITEDNDAVPPRAPRTINSGAFGSRGFLSRDAPGSRGLA